MTNDRRPASLVLLGQQLRDLYAVKGTPPAISTHTRLRVEAGVAKLQTVEAVAAAYGKKVVVTLEDV